MFGFYVLEEDTELFKVSWGDEINVAHVENFYGARHIKALDICTREGTERYYDIPFNKAMKFLETRTVPRTRVNINEILRIYKLKEYNALSMVKKDHGVSMTDYIWVRFFGEEGLKYDDVKVRDRN